jgi:hypothetical protein
MLRSPRKQEAFAREIIHNAALLDAGDAKQRRYDVVCLNTEVKEREKNQISK